jgi:hypothetical protein
MDSATLYGIAALGAIAAFFLWLASPRRPIYRCQRCGFETYSKEESAGHATLENSHKIVEE